MIAARNAASRRISRAAGSDSFSAARSSRAAVVRNSAASCVASVEAELGDHARFAGRAAFSRFL